MTDVLVRQAAQPHGVLVLLHSWWGLTEHFREMAERLAARGLTTVAPDLYGGPQTDDAHVARKLRRGLSDEKADARVSSAVDRARELSGEAPVAVLGFSMGAELGIRLAQARGAQVAAVVAFYGLCTPEGLAGLTAPVQVHLAGHDEFVTPREVGAFAEVVTSRGSTFEMYSYPGTTHAFFNRSRPEAYHPAAAELANRRAMEFLERHLRG